jgi:hypothetical protein
LDAVLAPNDYEKNKHMKMKRFDIAPFALANAPAGEQNHLDAPCVVCQQRGKRESRTVKFG